MLVNGEKPRALISHPCFVEVTDKDLRLRICITFFLPIPGEISPSQTKSSLESFALGASLGRSEDARKDI